MKKPMSNWSVMPMPPCICTPSCTASVAVVPARFCDRNRGSGIAEISVQRLQRLQHRGAGDLDLDIELRGAMLQRLEFADRLAELLALLEIADGAGEHLLAQSHHFRRHRAAADIQQTFKKRITLIDLAEHMIGVDLDIVEIDARRVV